MDKVVLSSELPCTLLIKPYVVSYVVCGSIHRIHALFYVANPRKIITTVLIKC